MPHSTANSAPLPMLTIMEKTVLPIVQGGMGVGISAHRLAGTVASENAVGTIASIDLRHHHPDLIEATRRKKDREENKAAIWQANLVALDREIKKAREIAKGRGLIAVNVMRAVSQYKEYVRQSCESGADAIVMGAGLPLDLPDLVADFPRIALFPILSDVRGVALLLKKWMRKKRLPEAIVIEHPAYAGGHLGAMKQEEVNDSRFDFQTVIPGILEVFRDMGLEAEKIPLIPAGGIHSHKQVRELFALGASAVQLGTAFAVSEEGDAAPAFKQILLSATEETVVEFMSCAGLPARAVRTPWLEKYLAREKMLMKAAETKSHQCTLAWDCLLSCGLRDANPKYGQFCIDQQLSAAVLGDVQRGLFFRGKSRVPFGRASRPARELIHYLLTGEMPKL
ncbi:MAG: nitronate monooxygenase family protein [Betaproteobacteria bacterium]|nr:nitronate monooxygenase family protein [Betaproteobacteria bacterium]